jgi:uncharacterized delta-60 repeat protein
VTRAEKLLASALLCSAGMLGAGQAHAAAGALDPTFGQGGQVTISLPNLNAIVGDAVLQPADGKIVVNAEFQEIVVDQNASDNQGLIRLSPNGSLDSTFGTGGVARFPVGGGALALPADGKFVVAAAGNAAFAVTRFNANGTLDSSFGNGGTVTTNIAGFPGTSVTAVVVYPGSGQILVGGSASPCVKCASDTVLVRYNSDGSLDPAFGNGGTLVVKAISASAAAPTALALLSNSDILTVAESAIAEFGGNGSLHSSVMSTVSGATILATSQGGQTVFQTNGDFVFASSVEGERGRKDIDIQLVRFLPQGNVDSTFNSPVFDFGAEAAVAESANALAIQPNGQIVAAGGADQFGSGGFGLARFNTSGGFDATFGSAGKLTTPFPNADANVGDLLLQPDGKIVAIGTEIVNGGGPANLVAARYLGQ